MSFLRNIVTHKEKCLHKDNNQCVLTPTTISPNDKAYKTVENNYQDRKSVV